MFTDADYALAKINYDAYKAQAGGKSLVSKDVLPEFSALKPEIKDAWAAGAIAVKGEGSGPVADPYVFTPNPWFVDRKLANPFEIKEDPTSLEAANHVAKILKATVVDAGLQWDKTQYALPAKAKYVIQVIDSKGAKKSASAFELVGILNNSTPDSLRVRLNELGFTALGPAPIGAKVSYESNYCRDPSSNDPGPVPESAK